MGANAETVRQEAMRELARRELQRRKSTPMRERMVNAAKEILGPSEAGLSLATGMVSAPLNEFIAAGADAIPGGDTGESILANPPVGTYQPRTKTGRAIVDAANVVMSPVTAAIDWAADTDNPDPAVRATGHLLKGALGVLPAVGASRALRGRPTPTLPAPDPAAVAQQYIARNTGLNWNAIPQAMRDQLIAIATDARTLDNLDPAAVERQIQLGSLEVPVPATRGQMTRDPVLLRNEGNVSATTAGQPIRDIYRSQHRAIIDNLEILRGRTRGTAQTPEQVGLSVQDQALRAKLAVSNANVRALYAAAEAAGELQGRVNVLPLRETLDRLPNVQSVAWVNSWLDQLYGRNASNAAKGKAGPSIPDRNSVTIAELEELRKSLVQQAQEGGVSGYNAGKVIAEIDRISEGIGGTMYKAARAARRREATEFGEQASVARLVENKTRTDRATALEDTWRQTVRGGSIQDLRNVKRSLLTGGTAQTRTAGRQAWRDIQAQTIQEIINEATKSVTRWEDGTPNVTPASMERALKAIGPQKLEEIFGPGTVRKLNEIMEATRTVTTEPPTGFKGSPTFANIISMLERTVFRVPGLGFAGDLARGAVEIRKMGAAARDVAAAQATPLGDAVRASQKSKWLTSRYKTAQNVLMASPYAPAISNALAEKPR